MTLSTFMRHLQRAFMRVAHHRPAAIECRAEDREAAGKQGYRRHPDRGLTGQALRHDVEATWRAAIFYGAVEQPVGVEIEHQIAGRSDQPQALARHRAGHEAVFGEAAGQHTEPQASVDAVLECEIDADIVDNRRIEVPSESSVDRADGRACEMAHQVDEMHAVVFDE
jgi:hypothetical protein